jgi:hypothetical protein
MCVTWQTEERPIAEDHGQHLDVHAEKRHFHWPVSAIHILKLEK